MKKKFLLLVLAIFFLVGCATVKDEKPKDNYYNDNKELISCLENELTAHIVTELKSATDIPLNTFTRFENKVDYYKGAYSDDDNMFAIVQSNESVVLEDFDSYFSSKYDVYQTYYIVDGTKVYIRSDKNDVDLKELKKCGSGESVSFEEIDLDSKVINKLSKTKKVNIKIVDTTFGSIKDKSVIDEVLDIISKSKQYKGVIFTCDGSAISFEMYDSNDELIDSITVWADGRVMPDSISRGCEYYIVPSKFDIEKFIERETDYVFYTLGGFSTDKDTDDFLYEDDDYKYYVKHANSNDVTIRFNTNGLTMKLKYALKNDYIKPKQLVNYSELIIRREK